MSSRRLTGSFTYPRREMVARTKTRIARRTWLLTVGLLALAAFAGVLYLSQVGVAAELRNRLEDREREAHGLWEQNLVLKRAVADADRLETAEAQAARLGMAPAPAAGPYIAVLVPQAGPALAAGPAGVGQADYLERLAAQLGWRAPGQPIVLNAGHP